MAAEAGAFVPYDAPDVEILVHVVSHQDVIFRSEQPAPGPTTYIKPKFHKFNMATKKVFWHMVTPEARPSVMKATSESDGLNYPVGLRLAKALAFDSTVEFLNSDEAADTPLAAEDFSSNTIREAADGAPMFAASAGGGSGGGAPVTAAPAAVTAAPAAVAAGAGSALAAGPASSGAPLVDAALFPLVAALVPCWKTAVLRRRAGLRSAPPFRQVLLLLSGSGRRRDDGSPQANSTRYCARLIRRFAAQAYGDVEVWMAHSHHDVYKHNQNVIFLRAVRGAIEAFRRPAVDQYGERWAEHFGVMSALAGGTPARVAAAAATLRPFEPPLLHVVELKRMWFLDRFTLDDVDVQSFDRAEAQHRIGAGQLRGEPAMLVAGMERHYREFRAVRDAGEAEELSEFWLRKSSKPVLAVLLVRWPPELRAKVPGLPEHEIFRGVNMEVSLPTGSLCSERAAMAQALARRPFLRRRHCVGIAVLSASLVKSADPARREALGAAPRPDAGPAAPLAWAPPASPPCQGMTHEQANAAATRAHQTTASGLHGLIEAPGGCCLGHVFGALKAPGGSAEHADGAPASPGRDGGVGGAGAAFSEAPGVSGEPAFSAEAAARVVGAVSPASRGSGGPQQRARSMGALRGAVGRDDVANDASSETSSVDLSAPEAAAAGGTPGPAVRIAVRRQLGRGAGGSDVLSNPLLPCGSCSEWLRKIKEVQPDFRVITFSDTSLTSVIIQSVE